MSYERNISSNAMTMTAAQGFEMDRILFRVKDPLSALTHFIGFWAAILSMPFLLIRASEHLSRELDLFSLGIFMLSMILLYGASTAYHTFNISRDANKILKKIDHSMIFVLIAGSYTPVCVIVLNSASGYRLLALVWAMAFAGIIFKLCWVTCPKWVSSVIYIAMGWLCVTAFSEIYHALPHVPFLWLLTGGIVYTIGGVIYALKLPLLKKFIPGFGAHELFHVFVMGGSFCHFMCMYLYAVGR